MRLFIAINFDDNVKDMLCDIQERLQGFSICGNFTLRENLHLTLVFIGEVDGKRIEDIKSTMKEIDCSSFELKLKGCGAFKRDDRKIWWIGIQKNNFLNEIYKYLGEGLRNRGFKIEDREYRPHLTIAREVMLKDVFNKEEFYKTIPETGFTVKKISLMKSERIGGKLVYSVIFEKEL